jgi:hypothetical protein
MYSILFMGVFLMSFFVVRENSIEGVLELTFSTDDQRFGEFVTIDLKENGRNIPVTDENKAEYVQYVLGVFL